MLRPGKTIALFVILFGCTLSVHAQAVSLSQVSSGSVSQSKPEFSLSAGQSTSALDFSLMNWQLGQLSPYSRSNLYSSSATSSILTTLPTLNPTNPFVGPTIGMTGGMTNSGKATPASNNLFSSLTIQTISGTSIANNSHIYSTSRFISYTGLKPDYGLNNSLIIKTEEPVSVTMSFDPLGTDMTRFASVPEPGTWVLIGGLFAIAGYGYARRKTTQTRTGNEQLNETKFDPQTSTM